MLLINFKAYSQGTGDKAIHLAKIVEKLKKELGKEIFVVPNFVDLKEISKITEVFAPHMDGIEPGAHTGYVTYEMLEFCKGVVLNHSEKQMEIEDIEKAINLAKAHGLKVVACANDIAVSKAISVFEPDYVAVEPPELIGGDISVSSAKPEVIKGAVDAVRSVSKSKVLVGAGIKGAEDVKRAVELGAEGVFVASGIVKADDPEKAITAMAGELK